MMSRQPMLWAILVFCALLPSALLKKKDEQDLSKIPGVPGHDYPLFKSVPPTNFHCGNVPYAPGMYANVETGCAAYHVCHDGREGHQGAAFLCPNGTLFNQHIFACDWWYNVNCADSVRLYDLNLDPDKNPYFAKKKEEEPAHPAYAAHAVHAGQPVYAAQPVHVAQHVHAAQPVHVAQHVHAAQPQYYDQYDYVQ